MVIYSLKSYIKGAVTYLIIKNILYVFRETQKCYNKVGLVGWKCNENHRSKTRLPRKKLLTCKKSFKSNCMLDKSMSLFYFDTNL